MPTVVEGLAFEEGRGRRQMGDRGHGQVVVGVRRGGVLGGVWEVLLGGGGV